MRVGEGGAEPGPVLEMGFGGVVEDVVVVVGEVSLVADEVVVVFGHPKGAAAGEEAVGSGCGEGFPRVEDGVESVRRVGADKGVDVVGHDAPGEEVVAGGVEVEEDVGEGLCDFGVAKVALADAAIEVLFDVRGEEVVEAVVFLAGEVALQLGGGVENVLAFLLVGAEEGLGEGIGKAEGDGVSAAGEFPVREVASGADGEHEGNVVGG